MNMYLNVKKQCLQMIKICLSFSSISCDSFLYVESCQWNLVLWLQQNRTNQ
ncbi:hypothetical protein Plhal710r2_c014g0063361 [Plasmopara halstedii]